VTVLIEDDRTDRKILEVNGAVYPRTTARIQNLVLGDPDPGIVIGLPGTQRGPRIDRFLDARDRSRAVVARWLNPFEFLAKRRTIGRADINQRRSNSERYRP
jgi:hypothetical protein